METTQSLAPAQQLLSTSSPSKFSDKERKIASLLSQARLMKGLPLLAETELRLGISSWSRALKDVPLVDLDVAFDRAIEEAPLGEPFGAPNVRAAYVHIAEERGRDRRNDAFRNPGTFRCWLCQDEGFQPVLIFCKAWNSWFGKMRPCGCDALKIEAQMNPVEPPDWQKNERGIWEPVNHAGFRCGCLACHRRRE